MPKKPHLAPSTAPFYPVYDPFWHGLTRKIIKKSPMGGGVVGAFNLLLGGGNAKVWDKK